MAGEKVVGLTSKDYRDPAEILGAPIAEGDLPSDVKFFLKHKKTPVNGVQKLVTLYELKREPDGLKMRLEVVEQYVDRIPEDGEIALEFGPSVEGYKWIAKWLDANGDRVGIESETILISERWRDRHEEHKRKKKADRAATEAPPVSAAFQVPAVPAAPAAGLTFMEMRALLREGKEEAISDMERLSAIMEKNKSDSPASVMERAWDSVGKVMERVVESQLQTVKKVSEAASRAVEEATPEQVEEEEEMSAQEIAESENAAPALPAWLAPFIPMAQKFLDPLLGGGPVGAAVKTLILSTDQWKEIFSDGEKFEQAKAAMRLQFGEANTEKALKILLNVRDPKPATKGKTKGK